MWVIKTFLVAMVLIMVVYAIEYYLHIPILTDAVLAITIVLCIGFAHEAFHFMTAIKLGYQPKWYRTTFKMGFEIGHHSNRGKWIKDKKKIARAPYYVLVPLSILLVFLGYMLNNIGVLVAGIGSLLMHGISYPSEGKDA